MLLFVGGLLLLNLLLKLEVTWMMELFQEDVGDDYSNKDSSNNVLLNTGNLHQIFDDFKFESVGSNKNIAELKKADMEAKDVDDEMER